MRFQRFDSLLAQLKAFTNFEGKSIEDYGITEPDYEEYAAHYRNVIEELRNDRDNGDGDDDELDNSDVINTDYELLAYSHVRIDYDYIISLIQNIVSAMDDDEENEDIRQKKLDEIREYIQEKGQNISVILENMRREAILLVVSEFSKKWFVDEDAVCYAVEFHRNGEIPNANVLKDSINYAMYKESVEKPLPKFKCRNMMIAELEQIIMTKIIPLQQR